ncbi:hypothetical protein [Fulvivirga ligni]|uniref:hypothetical protein n=1 Tax=Fulvivirga ligni TaxID=2904246 RepID=UPI001F223034|nr:hypothetical protein [Fulvivirga ligni]UII21867.1 hypothetical protein LVD16_01290 [Fulvivirga ligni]
MKKLSYLFFACFISLSLMNCAEDGEPGPAGKDGVDGIDGVDGVDGVDGQDGEGFEELTKDGSIILYFDGTRPDGIEFEDSVVFTYSNDIPSTVELIEDEEEGTYYEVELTKFTTPSLPFFEGGGYFDFFYKTTDLSNNADFSLDGLYWNSTVTTSDNKAFRVTGGIEGELDLTITDYNYDETTGRIQFGFSFVLDDNMNSTYHELNVTGKVDVNLYEIIYPEMGPM